MARQKSGDKPKPADALRARAEEMLRAKAAHAPAMSTADAEAVVYELNVHQVELEIQNEELRQSEIELAEARDRYVDLYEFAPVGYATLDKGGKILEANLTLATMLGCARQDLIGANISNFVARRSQDDWYRYRKAAFSTHTRQTCEVDMLVAGGPPMVVRVEGVMFESGDDRHSWTAIIDITERNQA